MKILIYTGRELRPLKSGVDRATDNLVNMLRSKGYNVVLLFNHINPEDEHYRSDVPVYFVPFPNNQKHSENKLFIRKLLLDNSISVIIDQSNDWFIGTKGFFNSRHEIDVPNVKLVAVKHTDVLDYVRNYIDIHRRQESSSLAITCVNSIYSMFVLPIKQRIVYNAFKRHSIEQERNFDKIILLSEKFKEDYLELVPKMDDSKLVAIPNISTFQSNDNSIPKEKIVIWVGRLEYSPKKPNRILDVWSKVENQHPEWTLKILGGGSYEEKMKEQINCLGLRNVDLLGFVDPEEYYKRASIIAMTSDSEGFGLVLIEAMTFSCVPILFNSFKAASDIVENESNGILIHPFDIDEFANQLNNLMLASMDNQYSIRAKEVHTKFSFTNVASKWDEMIKSLIK